MYHTFASFAKLILYIFYKMCFNHVLKLLEKFNQVHSIIFIHSMASICTGKLFCWKNPNHHYQSITYHYHHHYLHDLHLNVLRQARCHVQGIQDLDWKPLVLFASLQAGVKSLIPKDVLEQSFSSRIWGHAQITQ